MPSKTRTMMAMRKRNSLEPAPYSTSSSRGSSNDSLNAIWKPPQDTIAGSSTNSSATPSLRSQTGSYPSSSFPGYYEEEDLPFDQQSNFKQPSAPSFDEATDDPATDENEESIAPPQVQVNVSELPVLGTHAYYESETDDSVLLNDAQQRQQAQALHLSRRNLDVHREAPPPPPPFRKHHRQSPKNVQKEAWVQQEKDWRRAEEGEMEYHNESFEDYGISNNPRRRQSRTTPPPTPEDYHIGSYNQQAAPAPASPPPPVAIKKPRSILKQRTYVSDAEDSMLKSSEDGGDGGGKISPSSEEGSEQLGQQGGKQPRRCWPKKRSDTDEGETSEEHKAVQRRTKEAFGKREKNNPRKSLSAAAENEGAGNRGVSFQKRHKVHRYEQEEEEDSETQFTGWTGTSSYNSAYSKSMESEVEDLVKDLFFLGEPRDTQPGRRGSRSRRSEALEDTTVGDSTLDTNEEDITLNTDDDNDTFEESTYEGTVEESTGTWSDKGSKATRSSDQTEDPLISMWQAVQGSVQSVGVALGIAEEEPVDTKKKKKKKKSRSASPKGDQDKESSMETTATEDDDLDNSQSSTLADMIDMASGVLFGTDISKNGDSKFHKSLEDDGRLAELAVYAARSKHEVHGLVFDESKPVDIVSEVKFSVVKVLLPMGILFQENPGGCWVTKVFSSGNAALRAKGGTVEVGDQLAAINGTSAIELKVDKVCSLVSQVPKGKAVELTFLRYTGPMRPSRGLEEGYEVRDPSMERGGLSLRNKKNSGGGWRSSRRKVKVEPPKSQQPPRKNRFRIFGRGKKR